MDKFGKPLGPRVLVQPEEAEDATSKRAAAAGLAIVLETKNRPRPTTGVVVALGTDPLIADMGLVPGIRVGFGVNAGSKQFIEGREYRLLETQEISMILPPLDEAISREQPLYEEKNPHQG